MIKCPNCNNSSSFEYQSRYEGETFGISRYIQEYKCNCGYILRKILIRQCLGEVVEEEGIKDE